METENCHQLIGRRQRAMPIDDIRGMEVMNYGSVPSSVYFKRSEFVDYIAAHLLDSPAFRKPALEPRLGFGAGEGNPTCTTPIGQAEQRQLTAEHPHPRHRTKKRALR